MTLVGYWINLHQHYNIFVYVFQYQDMTSEYRIAAVVDM